MFDLLEPRGTRRAAPCSIFRDTFRKRKKAPLPPLPPLQPVEKLLELPTNLLLRRWVNLQLSRADHRKRIQASQSARAEYILG